MQAPGLELDFGLSAVTPLPPPRAARTPRSRGFFLKAAPDSKKPQRKWSKWDLSIVAFAVAVVALASALIVGAPSAMLGSTVSLNPGPAMVGATSVAPAFFTPHKAR